MVQRRRVFVSSLVLAITGATVVVGWWLQGEPQGKLSATTMSMSTHAPRGNPPPNSGATSASPETSTPAAVAIDPDAMMIQQVEALARTLFYLQCLEQLQTPAVRSELSLSQEQSERFDVLQTEFDQLNAETKKSSAAEHEALGQRFEGLGFKIQTAMALLNDAQYQRVALSVLQRQIGSLAFLMPGVPETVGLTPMQRETFCRRIDRHREEFDPARFSVWKIPRLILVAREARAAAEADLTDAQAQRWKEMLAGQTPLMRTVHSRRDDESTGSTD